jgi:hypothetical protein
MISITILGEIFPPKSPKEGPLKIIGKTADGYILEASEEEVANFVGYYGYEQRGQYRSGTEIRESPLFDQLKFLKTRDGTLANIIGLLRQYADNLELIDPVAIKEIHEGAPIEAKIG